MLGKSQAVNLFALMLAISTFIAKMAEIGAKLGGEQSGHILSPRYSVSGDGTLTALHIAVLVKESGKSLEQMLADSFVAYPQILKNVRVKDAQRRQNWQECQPLQQAIADAETGNGRARQNLSSSLWYRAFDSRHG